VELCDIKIYSSVIANDKLLKCTIWYHLNWVDVDGSFFCPISSVFSACLWDMHCLKDKPLILFNFNMPFINSGLGFYNNN
jgi:hypothetical protein